MVKSHRSKSSNEIKIVFLVVLIAITIFILLFYIISLRPNFVSGLNMFSLKENGTYPLVFSNFSIYELNNFSKVYIRIMVTNDGNSVIGFNSGCFSPITGEVSSNIANITTLNNQISCDFLTISFLKPGQSIFLIWPSRYEALNVHGVGKFYLNLTLNFRFYNEVKCQANNICFNFNGSTGSAYSILGLEST